LWGSTCFMLDCIAWLEKVTRVSFFWYMSLSLVGSTSIFRKILVRTGRHRLKLTSNQALRRRVPKEKSSTEIAQTPTPILERALHCV
jgi:hypothetical protein